MRRLRVVSFTVLGLAVATPLVAQGIPRGARRTTTTISSSGARLMVAIPTVSTNADSATAVAVGQGMRKRVEKIVGSEYAVVPDSIMNAALVQYGYPPNAILSPALNVNLAKNIPSTRVVITSTMTRAGGAGRYAVTSRVVGIGDDVGYVANATQDANQSPADLGGKVADTLAPGIKAMSDARACMEQRQAQKPDKALEAATKALKDAPNHGLAHYCLAMIATDQKKPVGEVLQHLQEAAKGDNQSLPVYSKLADIYQVQNDTAKTVAVFGDLLRVAPTNQKLRENIFRYLLNAGRPDVAKAVADSGLKLDAYNADLYDLKSNACAFLGDFKCAVDALETAYSVDSTKADTLFLAKVVAFAQQRLSDTLPRATQEDTARYVKWVKLSAAKSPNSPAVLSNLIQAYGFMGQTDSALAVTRKLLAIDSTSVVPALAAVQSLATSKQLDGAQAQEFIAMVERRGDAQAKDQLAAILVTAASPYLSGQDFKKASQLLRRSAALADPNGRVATPANFYFGVAAFQYTASIDSATEKQKSCEGAKQEQKLLEEAGAALTKGRAAKPETADQLQVYVGQFNKRVASMIKAYCK